LAAKTALERGKLDEAAGAVGAVCKRKGGVDRRRIAEKVGGGEEVHEKRVSTSVRQPAVASLSKAYTIMHSGIES